MIVVVVVTFLDRVWSAKRGSQQYYADTTLVNTDSCLRPATGHGPTTRYIAPSLQSFELGRPISISGGMSNQNKSGFYLTLPALAIRGLPDMMTASERGGGEGHGGKADVEGEVA